MSIMKNEDYMYLYSQLTNDKIPQHIKEKIEKDLPFTEAEEQEMLDIIKNDIELYRQLWNYRGGIKDVNNGTNS